MNLPKVIVGFFCIAMLLSGNRAFSAENSNDDLPVPAKTGLRCLYKTSDSNLSTDFSWEWGGGDYYWLDGYWRSKKLLANVFYTGKTQLELLALCQDTFRKKGINKPVAMMAAADNSASTNYMIWNIDGADQINKINKIISFGDSLSDTQNTFNASTWGFPIRANFYMGRYSNGKNWLDYFSEKLSLPVYDWSTGGAGVKDEYGMIPGLRSQVSSWVYYMNKNYAKNYRPDLSLFTITIGVNDLKSYDRSAKDILDEVNLALNELIKNGAKNILILNLPDLTHAPAFKVVSADKIKHIQHQVTIYDRDLAPKVAAIIRANPGVRIWIFDTYSWFKDFLTHATNYGVTNTTQSCLSIGKNDNDFYTIARARRPECEAAGNQADSFLFWDTLHPTTRAHQLLANKVYCHLEKESKSNSISIFEKGIGQQSECH